MSGRWAPFPELTHVVGREMIDAYAGISGDYNPLHMDPEFAAAGQFGTVIAHGPIGLQVMFEAVAQWLGTDGVPVGVLIDVAYRGPVRIGDSVTCHAQAPSAHAGDVVLPAECVNQNGDPVLQALIVVPRRLAPPALS
jgi:3-hydroxybutyryl-CoA dehydratase